ncbi:MAG: hypothetical protein ACHQHO_04245 [Solirubrobacterales bacterium]
MERRGRSRISLRALLGLVLCGALAGYTLPALASSLIRQEKRQPDVRLLPTPPARVEQPSPEPEQTDEATTPITIAPGKRPKPLTRAQLKRKNPPPPARILAGPRLIHRPPVASHRGAVEKSSPAPEKQASKTPKVNPAGGVSPGESGGKEATK